MDITIEPKKLAIVLERLSLITKGKLSLPILSNVYITTGDGKIKLSATNLDVWQDQECEAVVNSPGTVCVDNQTFLGFISTAKSAALFITADGHNLRISSDDSVAMINGTDPHDFPTRVDGDWSTSFSIKGDVFVDGVKKVVDVVSDDMARLPLTGVYIHSYAGKMYLVATDGFRLVQQYIGMANSDIELLVMPLALSIIARMLTKGTEENITVSYNNSTVSMCTLSGAVKSRLINAQYPDYMKLIPSSFEVRGIVSKGDLQDALHAVSLFSSKESKAAELFFDGDSQTIVVSAASEGKGSAEITVESFMYNRTARRLKLNGRHASTALYFSKTDDVMIEFNQNGPILFSSSYDEDDTDRDGYLHVVMPLKY